VCPSTRAPPLPRANEAIGARSRKKYRTRHVMNSIVTPATIHLKEIAVKSQELGKQILREGVFAANRLAAQQGICFRAL
jgi:hypothetical protein